MPARAASWLSLVEYGGRCDPALFRVEAFLLVCIEDYRGCVTLCPVTPHPCSLLLMFDDGGRRSHPDALLVLLPLLVILSTFLFLLLTFLICVLIVRRRRGIILRDSDGPVDMSREELIEGDGGFENIEARWLEDATEISTAIYLRAKGMQCPSNLLRHPHVLFA